MNKKYIKMNGNNNYLSLGNLFGLIKKLSNNKSSAMQVEIFCSIFGIKEINNTTVNNYCIGCRAVGFEYKKVYLNLKKEYQNNKEVFINIVLSILSIMDEIIYVNNSDSLNMINGNKNLKKLLKELLVIANNDSSVNRSLYNKILNLYDTNDLYTCFVELLIYIILENKQPIFEKKIEVKINKYELEEYLKVKFYEGISYILSLKYLSKKDNMYANADLGSLEFSGLIDGNINYEKCFNYYLASAKKGHPKACFMVANLILSGRYGDIKKDFNTMWFYLNKSIELGSVAGINTMGKCYLMGITEEKNIDETKAIRYFDEASSYGYAYAYNNLGLLYEKKDDINTAIKYYKLSADLGESWALNKVGEYYRKKGDLNTAYFYYLKSSEAPINERNYYSYYNLAKYYYSVGNESLKIEVDKKKTEYYFDIACKHGIDL